MITQATGNNVAPSLKRPSRRGFSLLEVMITLAVLTIMMGPMVAVFFQSGSSFRAQSQQVELTPQMRIAMDQISRCIRQAGNDPSESTGAPPVTVLGSGRIRIATDITGSVPGPGGSALGATGDPDGRLTGLYEIAEFRLDPGRNRVLANIGQGEEVLAEGISGLTFTCLDLNGAPTADPAAIARVQVAMTGQTDDADLQMGRRYTMTLQSEIFIRSRTPQVIPE